MPISIEEYANPKWIKQRERYPLSYDKKDRYYNFASDLRGYRGGLKLPGYNPSHNSITIERINLESDDISLRGN